MKKQYMIALIVTMMIVILPAIAVAQLLFPSSMKTIEAESFYGDMSIREVQFPEGLERIESKAFARTALTSVLMPSTIEYIAPDAFDECEHLVIKLLEPNDYVAQWCADHQIPMYILTPTKLEIGADRPTLVVGDTSLLSAELYLSDEITAPTMLTWSTNNADVVIVDQYGLMTAIAQGTATITCEATVNGEIVTGNVTVEVIMPSVDTLEIISAAFDKATYKLGEPVTLTVQTNENTMPLTYTYYLTQKGSSSASKTIRNTASNTVSFTPGTGTWTVTIVVSDQHDRIAEFTTDSIQVLMPEATELHLYVVADQEDALPNTAVTWAVSIQDVAGRSIDTEETAQISSYRFTVIRNGCLYTQMTNITSDTISISLSMPGEYEVEVEATDAHGNLYTGISNVTTVWEEEIGALAAPQLLGGDGFATLSTTEASAVEMSNAAFSIRWNTVEMAEHYRVILQQKNGSAWEEKSRMDEILTDHAKISASEFINQTETAIYRIAVQAVGKKESQLIWYYFSVPNIDKTVSFVVNGAGQNSINWFHPWIEEATRTFTVSSEQPCIVTECPSWVNYYLDGNQMSVTIQKFTKVFGTRNGQLKISNGTNEAVINIQQEWISSVLEVESTNVLSESESNPGALFTDSRIQLSTNSFDRFGAAFVYEKTSAGYDKLVGTKYFDDREFTLDISLTAGKQYQVRFYHMLSAQAEEHDFTTLPCSIYYGTCTEPSLTINGAPSATVDMSSSYDVYVYVLSTHEISFTSDSSWLSCQWLSNLDRYCITCDPNTTDSERTGHVTFTAGGKTAVLTVNQPSNLYMVYPTNLSTSKSSPTSLAANKFNFVFSGDECSITNTDGGTNAVLYEGGGGCFTYETSYVTDGLIVVGDTYEIKLATAGVTKTYYVKCSSSSATASISVATGTTDDGLAKNAYSILRSRKVTQVAGTYSFLLSSSGSWTASSNASWLTLGTTSGSSCSKKSIDFTVTANTGDARTATITLKRSTAATATLTVHQAAKSEHFVSAIDKDTGFEPGGYAGSSARLRIFASDTVEVSSDASWMTFDSNTVEPNADLRVSFEKNTSQSSARTATLTLTVAGTNTKQTYTFKQSAAVGTPALTSPSLSTDQTAPTLLSGGQPVTIQWDAAANAARYALVLYSYTADGQGRMAHYNKITSNGSSAYSVTLSEQEVFDLSKDSYQIISLRAYAEDGTAVSSDEYCFKISYGNMAVIDCSTAPSWINVDDFLTIRDFNVSATGSWTVSTDSSWIEATAVDSETLRVAVSSNTSDTARTGHVTVEVGNAATVLTVTQCAALRSTIDLAPDYSEFIDDPTLLSTAPSSITLNWTAEPQADNYKVFFYSTNAGRGSPKTLKSTVDTYTLSDMSITPGEVYCVEVVRIAKLHGAAVCRKGYFMVLTDSPSLALTGDDVMLFGANETKAQHVVVTSNAQWSARASESWMMIGDHPVKVDDLGDGRSYISSYGSSGDNLYVSVLPNMTGKARVGTVRVFIGDVEHLITVKQGIGLQAAELISPNLSIDSAKPSSVQAGSNLLLKWSESSDPEQNYRVSLYSGSNYRTKVYEKAVTKTQSLILSADLLDEGEDYQLILETRPSDEATDPVRIKYYFRIGYINELIPTLNITEAKLGGYLHATASATGGSDSYMYAYALLRNGEVTEMTEYGSWSSYDFAITTDGAYRVRLYVQDSNGQTATTESRTTQVSSTLSRRISGKVLTGNGKAVSNVNVTFYINGQSKSAGTATTNASGIFYWDEARIDCKYQLSFDKEGVSFPNGYAYAEISADDTDLGVIHAVVPGETNVVVDKTITVTGKVLKQDGTGYPFVAAKLTTTNGTIINSVYTSDSGSYAFPLTSSAIGQDYNITFSKDDATITPDTVRVHVSDAVTVSVQTVTAAAKAPTVADTCSFTMNKTFIEKDESVTFTITAPVTATAVRMYADGVFYPGDEVSVSNGIATMTRTFTSAHPSGVTITFAPVINGVIGQQSAPLILTVTAKSELAKPSLNAPATIQLGQNYAFTVGSVANATYYIADLCAKTEGADNAAYTCVWYTDGFSTSVPVTISADIFKLGYEYKLTVSTAAPGYICSSTEQHIAIEKESYGLTVNAVKDNSNKLWVETGHTGGYMRVVVTSPAGEKLYWPAADELPTAESPVAPAFQLTSGGMWTVEVFIYASADAAESAYVDYYSGAQIVDGPAIKSILPYGMQWNWVTEEESKKFVVTTNSSVDQIQIHENGVLLGTYSSYNIIGNNNRSFTCSLPAATNKKHTYDVTGISILSDNLATLSKSFHVVKEINTSVPKHVYAKGTEVVLVESPMNSTPVFGGYVKGGEDFDEMMIIGDTEDWYQVRANEAEGFVKKSEVDYSPNNTGNKQVIIIKPVNHAKIPLDYTSFEIAYKFNFVLNENEAANISISIADQDTGVTVCTRTYFATALTFSTTGKTIINRAQKELPTGRYQLQITLKTVTGDLIASGNTYFTVGEYNAEDVYRTVWKQALLNDYNSLVGTSSNGATSGMIEGAVLYLPLIDKYVFGGTDGVLYAFMNYPSAPAGFSQIYRAAAMSMVNQFNKAYYDDRVGNNTSNYMITDDEVKKLSIQQMIMNSCDTSLGKGSINTNTLSSVTIATNIINRRNSDLEVISESVQALKDMSFVFADGVESYFAIQGNPNAKVIHEIKEPIKDFVDMIADITEAHFNGINDMRNLNEIIDAYVDDYEKVMIGICDDNISYLKRTYFGDSWAGSIPYADPYKEQARLVIDNYEKLKGDPANIRTEARSFILAQLGLTEEMLIKAMDPKYGDEISTIVLQAFVKEIVKESLKKATEAALCKIFNVPSIGINDVQYGYYLSTINSRIASAVDHCVVFENGVLTFKPEEFAEALCDIGNIMPDLGGVLVKEIFLYRFMKEVAAGTDLLSARNSVLKAASSLFSDCWSFGKHFAYAIRAEYDASQQNVGLGKFDREGSNLIISLDLISSVKANAGLVPLSAENIDSMSISELDALRSAVLTMLNDELLAIRTYSYMKIIRQNAGNSGQSWLATYKDENGKTQDYTWLTDAQIMRMESYLQLEINLFTKYAPPTL